MPCCPTLHICNRLFQNGWRAGITRPDMKVVHTLFSKSFCVRGLFILSAWRPLVSERSLSKWPHPDRVTAPGEKVQQSVPSTFVTQYIFLKLVMQATHAFIVLTVSCQASNLGRLCRIFFGRCVLLICNNGQ